MNKEQQRVCSYKNFFYRIIGEARIFDCGEEANHKSHAVTSSQIFERETFCRTKILWIGRSEAMTCVWQITRILLLGEGLNQS